MQAQSYDDQKKAAPPRASKKSDGWREREESRHAGAAPRAKSADKPTLVRN